MDSAKLRQRFCKDNNISIQLFQEPFFSDRLRLMGKLDEFNEFIELINTKFNGNPELYFNEYNSLKDKIIDYIKESLTFQTLNNDDMNKYTCTYSFKQSDVYKVPNIGSRFISIDMKKANFSALVHYGINNNCKFANDYDWEQFMKQFTDIEHFIKSKYIRQVVLGNCNPRRQVTYEKYLMNTVLDELFESGVISQSEIYSMCHDEIIIYADELTYKQLDKIRDIVENYCAIPLRFEYFTLGKITNSDAYVKKIHLADGSTQIVPKCLSSIEAPAIYRMLNGELVNAEDNYFYHEGRLAKYIDNKQYEIVFE